MGCTSSTNVPNSTIIVQNISDKNKQRLSEAIQNNNIIQLALIMQEIQAYPNSQISQPTMLWMLTHLCCRWDADFCLQYLLRLYFMENPRGFINFVNSQTIQGYTYLHLCCIWNSFNCLKILNTFGGLYLQIKDNKLKTPYQYALQYKCAQISNTLKQYKSMNVQFVYIQVQKLLQDPLIPNLQTFQNKKHEQDQIQQKLKHEYRKQFQKYNLEIKKQMYQKQNIYEHNTNITQYQKQLLSQKSQIQTQLDRLLEEKLKKELDYDLKRALICVYIQIQQLDRSQFQKLEKQKLVDELEKQKRTMLSEISVKDQSLKFIHQEIKKMERQKLQKIKSHSNAKTQEIFAKFNLQISNKIKQMKIILDKYRSTYKVSSKMKSSKSRQSSKNFNKSDQNKQLKKKCKQLPVQIRRIYQQAKSCGQFVDKQFPPQHSSIGDASKSKYAIFTQNSIWLRPAQFFKSQFKLFDGVDSDDIKQGSLGVCYLLATLSALALNPKNITQIFKFHDLQLGFYVLRLYVNGIPKYFTVDDLIPCNKTTKSPLFTQPIGKQIWVLLLEKAWVKLLGSYLNAQSMTPDHIMEDLTGAPGYGWWLTKQNIKTPTQKIKQIVKHCSLGHIVVVTSVPDKNIEGIVNNHAYSLLSVYQYNNRYIFKIRNPWGRFQWNGQFSQQSSLCTQQFKKKVGYQNKQPGTFFISQNQLLKAFCFYSISHIKNDYHYSYSQFKSKKWESIFYTFKLTKSGDVNIRITQPFQRMIKDRNYVYSPMIFEMGKIISNNEVQFISQGHHRSYFGAKSVHAAQDIFQNLSQGEYFIHIRMIWIDEQKFNSAVLGVYAPEPVKIKKNQYNVGFELLEKLFISFSKNFTRNRAPNGFYRICTMKGQFLFIAQTEQQFQFKANFKFIKKRMVKTETDISKISDVQLQTITKKRKYGVATAMRTDPAQGGTTGPVSITFTKI